jgi:hypothetical protein
MNASHRWLVAALLVGGTLLAGCGPRGAQPEAAKEEPSRLEPIDGTDMSRVILTEEAADRLDIQTDAVTQEELDGAEHTVIPYSAVLYDVEGQAFAYTSPEPFTYVRAPLEIDKIDGDVAVLTAGPAVGTAVVTVGAAELYGAEFEFSEG